ncbi:hypothetical protein ACFVWG_04545 [Kribbella sp. NPDC058245]
MPTATIDDFDLDIRLQEISLDAREDERYPPETAPVRCTTSKYC